MTVVEFLLYLGAGRALIWLAQVNGLLKLARKRWLIVEEFVGCDLCVGFWIYLALALAAWPEPFGLWWLPFEMLVMAALATIGAYLLRLGWAARFGVTIIE